MSLVVDPDYIIHSLRLAYLRRIDDHHGPRIITLPSHNPDATHRLPPSHNPSTSSSSSSNLAAQLHRPTYSTTSAYLGPAPFHQPHAVDTHVALAGLADSTLHPQILSLHSPLPEGGSANATIPATSSASDLESSPLAQDATRNRHAKIGSGLRYTSTIYGPGRSGALGMRVDGRRHSKHPSQAATRSATPATPATPSAAAATASASASVPDASQDVLSRPESLREDPQTAPLDHDAFSPPPPPQLSLPDEPDSSADTLAANGTAAGESSSSGGGGARHPMTGPPPKPSPLSTLSSAEQADEPPPVADPAPASTAVATAPRTTALASDPGDDAFAAFQPIRSAEQPSSSSYAESSTDSNILPSSIGSPDYLRAGSIELPSIPAVQDSMVKSPIPPGLQASSPSSMAEEHDLLDRQGATARPSPVHARRMPPSDGAGPSSSSPSDVAGPAVDGEASTAPTQGQQRPKKQRSAKLRDRSRLQQQQQHQQQQEQARNEFFASLKASPETVAKRHAAIPKTSALSTLLHKQEASSENPFAAFYAGIAGRSGTAPSMNVDIYFPWAQTASTSAAAQKSGAVRTDGKAKSMTLNVRRDATMEELIGYGLYCYAEEGWKPELDAGGLSDDEQQTRLSTIGWTLRIVEDGEVDEDFPAIDRNLTLSKFGGDEFAIVEATAAQVKQHKEAYGAILRRASRVATPARPDKAADGAAGGATPTGGATAPAMATAGTAAATAAAAAAAAAAGAGGAGRLAVPQAGAHAGSMISVQGTPIFATGALSRSAMGPSSTSIFLRVLVTPNPEVRYKTTLQVPSDMYLADVLEMICRKRHLENVDEWALVVPDKSIVVPLDRTVESLQGNHDLALVRRSTLGLEAGSGALSTQSSNPNASIFKRFSTEPSHPKYTKALDVTASYKTFTVYRKTPMFVAARHERSLTLDGDWVHIMPVDMRTFQKAASFHISHVVACKVSERAPGSFKLVVWRESPKEVKRYDFEAESPRAAAEVVKEINALKSQVA
ncbi:uncharacterized protein PFL1_04901 [Pseudozyma flocculosa PF-1]|uniref:Related to Stress-activated map kinase interacting protein 1 n=2 Tax=Pseudozyma flocculosa TaxID=84751 RepID=A0A5C3EVC0_9BASI|nr:uncharacterized protein PFL1_04901 [Pseudozyma flocculosa PF-1]EPQ27362.1 hypothetical protein PFL1_04901 [Pseudozyma flocculosa PF-1]SPO36223.1 related to Stress-activated map kinase interacting protein 1 [Pseudozyma flocculosa]